jgi:hypothetical protein
MEYLGFIGMGFVMGSFLTKNIKLLRALNMIGSVLISRPRANDPRRIHDAHQWSFAHDQYVSFGCLKDWSYIQSNKWL